MKLTSELSELIGAHIGDGSMGKYKNGFIISFGGHPVEDKNYISWVASIYKKNFRVSVNLRKWSRILGFKSFRKRYLFFIGHWASHLEKKYRLTSLKKLRNLSWA